LNVKHRLFFFLGAIFVLVGCALPVSSVSPAATPLPGAVETVIVETAIAAQSQTAVSLPPIEFPTLTPTPTATSTRTPLPTSTVLFLFRTNTAVVLPTLPGSGDSDLTATLGPNEHNYKGTLACALVKKSPSDGTVFKPRAKFTVNWTVKNTGTASWKKHTIDYRYLGGDRFHDRGLYDMNFIVDPGETIVIKVNMYAPKEPGNYKTTWVVGLNKGGLCQMTLAIVVK